MGTTREYIEYVYEQLRRFGDVRYKKMFGEYTVYVNDLPLILVCDNTVFIKKTDKIAALMKDADCGNPYEGAKECYVLDVDNSELLKKLFAILSK